MCLCKNSMYGKENQPPALILGLQTTALATARSLSDMGIKVLVAGFSRAPAERRSRSFEYVDAAHVSLNCDDVAEWLYEFAGRLECKPVVFPTSDITALSLAKHRNKLLQVCHFSTTDYTELNAIICKQELYKRAENVGVSIPPAIVEPELDELTIWCQNVKPPFLVKPFYQNISGCKLGRKNMVFSSESSLLDFVEENGAKYLVIQKLIRGGDGHVLDCYGYCDHKFKVVTLASHVRIRQFPRDFGTTSYGEIPLSRPDLTEDRIFELTETLLSSLEYHGIFGIEWIEDRETKELYLIDFNARPFLSIGHLTDCGLNLPFLAYKELLGESVPNITLRPRLEHKFWVHLVNDIKTLHMRINDREISVHGWLASIVMAKSYAVWRWTDLGPGVHLLARYIKSLLSKR